MCIYTSSVCKLPCWSQRIWECSFFFPLHIWECVYLCVREKERGWQSACLRGVLAVCPALRRDKWLSVVVVQRADTQTAAHTWLIVSLLGLGPVDCGWAKASHSALPGICVCVHVCFEDQDREWWKAKTVKEGRRECYVPLYEFVCHWTLFWNMCYCFIAGHTVEQWGFLLTVVNKIDENCGCDLFSNILCSLE